MGLETQIYTQLADTSTLTDEVGTRIYRYRRNRGSAFPAVTFERIETTTENHSTGATVTEHCRVEVDSWAEDMDTCRTVADAVKTALSGWSNTGGTPSISMSHIQSDIDMTEEPNDGTDVLLHRISQDYELWYA